MEDAGCFLFESLTEPPTQSFSEGSRITLLYPKKHCMVLLSKCATAEETVEILLAIVSCIRLKRMCTTFLVIRTLQADLW